jgi:ZIP family zinc transporter
MEHGSFDSLLMAFMLTLFAGLSTAIGAGLAFFAKGKSTVFLSIGLGFSAGVMIYVSFMEILGKSKDAFSQIYKSPLLGESLAIAAFFGGIALSAFIDYLIPEDVNPHEMKSDRELLELKPQKAGFLHKSSDLKRTGIFTALAIGIHNFPEGFATFMSALDNFTIGATIAFAIAIHNIPEGMAVSLPIYHATGDKKTAFWYAALSGLAEPAGAVIGFFLLFPFLGVATMGMTFGIVAGIMIYISFDELLPAARIYGNAHTTIGGITLGMLVMALSLIAFKAV